METGKKDVYGAPSGETDMTPEEAAAATERLRGTRPADKLLGEETARLIKEKKASDALDKLGGQNKKK